MDVLYPTKNSYVLKKKNHNMWTLYVILKMLAEFCKDKGVVMGNRS